MAGKYRLLWVPSRERVLKCGDEVTEEALEKAGYSAKDMVERGEAELVSPKADAAQSPKAKAKK